MKSIIDILNEEGVATPLGTMGMGNSQPAGEPGAPGVAGEPGSEPVCAKCKKKKKKKVAESLLDDEDSIMDKGEIAMIERWIRENTTCKVYKIDPKTKEINCGYMNVAIPTENIPDYIKFGNIEMIKLRIDANDKELSINLPKKSTTVSLECRGVEKLIINNADAGELTIDADATKIVLPKRYNLSTLVVSNCYNLSNIENFNGAKIETLKLSPEFCKAIIKESLKIGPKAALYVFGNQM